MSIGVIESQKMSFSVINSYNILKQIKGRVVDEIVSTEQPQILLLLVVIRRRDISEEGNCFLWPS